MRFVVAFPAFLLFSVGFLMIGHSCRFVGGKGAELTSVFSLILSMNVSLVRISVATLRAFEFAISALVLLFSVVHVTMEL